MHSSGSEPFDSLLKEEIIPNAVAIDKSPMAMRAALTKIFDYKRSSTNPNELVTLTSDELDQVYGSSTALGFTIVQHLAAVERLALYPDWQSNNFELWRAISRAETLIGLATTHLAHPGPRMLRAKEASGGYQVSGTMPLVTGLGIFSHFMLAFDTEEERIYAVIKHASSESNFPTFLVDTLAMACLNGSGTSKILLDKFFVSRKDFLFKRMKAAPAAGISTAYVAPELGTAARAIAEMVEIITYSKNPRLDPIAEKIPKLQSKLVHFQKVRHEISDEQEDDFEFEKDTFVRNCVQLLAIAEGGQALMKHSLASRLHLELLLLDAVLQSPGAMRRKIDLAAGQ